MKAYELQGPGGVDEMKLVEKTVAAPGPGQVLVKLKAATINYRDLLTVKGGYGSRQKFPLVPLSDGAGVVDSVGAGVTAFKPGDRVTGSFFEGWLGGEPSEAKMRGNLGGALDGVLCEYRVWPAAALVRTPDHLTDIEAACLPCAGLTAWSAVVKLGNIKPGQTVLTQGTGGVSIFALQFAKMNGARVIATSSSDDKIDRLKTLGACDAVNYKTTPDWEQRVVELTGGRGVDCVVEIGGAGTLNRSFQTLAAGGKVVLIGMLAERDGNVNPYVLMGKNGSLHGVFVGDRDMFEEMNRAIDVNRIKPVVDRVFSFDQAVAAYRHHQSGQFVGKVVIAI